ncbi:rhomboid family intramembrane serine protease [Flavobacterium tegetincola]|uniref:rhomboid family intramembrane serine protease n=1 Tax=Flavobacterium tegetincola TaxID=150172 RepID=UPI000424BB56|nr:rhomboid family intramembrane serine protease [Flavobacterium tegetincola]
MSTALIVIILANVLFSYKGFNDLMFFRKYDFHIGSIRNGDQVRMFSSAFLHADMTHLFFNMLTLFFFAPIVVAYLGELSFILIYFSSLLFGNVLTLYLHKNNLNYRAIGASGAVTGVLYSAILLEPEMTINFFIPGYVFGILYLLYSIYGMRAKNDNIGHTAHFGGAIGGYLFTIIKQPEMLTNNTFYVVALAIPIVILFVMDRMGKL